MQTGYLRDVEDTRDWSWGTLMGTPADLPSHVSFESLLGPAYDQGPTTECVAWSCAALKRMHEFRQRGEWLDLDAPGLYRACKQIDGVPNAPGTYIRTAMKVLSETGIESADHRFHTISGYARCTAVDEMRHVISNGVPVVIGLPVDTPSIANLDPPFVITPPACTSGGHCMVLVGYDDDIRAFRVRNSWGISWADNGHGWLPYGYLDAQPTFDAWTTVDA